MRNFSYSIIDDSECYQETANVSTLCGGLDTGSYDKNGTWWSSPLDFPSTIDGDWGTRGCCSYGGIAICNWFANYTIPNGAILESSVWTVKSGHITNTADTTIDELSLESCYDNDNSINFMAELKYTGTYHIKLYCLNSSYEWNLLTEHFAGYNTLYEEAINWSKPTQSSDFPYVSTSLSTATSKKIISLIDYDFNATMTFDVTGVYPQNLSYVSDTSTYTKNYDKGEFIYYSNNNTIVVFIEGIEQAASSNVLTITNDTFIPAVTITNPQPIVYQGRDVPVSITTDENSSCKYSFDDFVTNTTLSSSDKLTHTGNEPSLPEDLYVMKFWCEDLNTNVNNTESVSFSVDFAEGLITESIDTSTSTSRSSDMSRDLTEGISTTENSNLLRDMIRRLSEFFNIDMFVSRLREVFRVPTADLSITDELGQQREVSKNLIQQINANLLVDGDTNFVKEFSDSFSINELSTRTAYFFREASKNIIFSISVDRVKSISKTVIQELSFSEISTRAAESFRNLLAFFRLDFSVDRTAYFYRNQTEELQVESNSSSTEGTFINLIQELSLSAILNKTSYSFKYFIETPVISELATRTSYFYRDFTNQISIFSSAKGIQKQIVNIIQQLTFSETSTRVLNSFRIFSDHFRITPTATRTSILFRNIIDSFSIGDNGYLLNQFYSESVTQSITTNINLKEYSGFFVDISNALNVNDIVSRTQTISRDVINQFSITELTTRTQEISKYLTSFFGITENINSFKAAFNNLNIGLTVSDSVSRTQTISRESQQTLSLDLLVDRTASISRSVTQFLQMFFNIFSTKTELDPWTKITSVEEKIQTPALGGETVYWSYKDTWTVDNYPRNWTNVTKTYELPSSANGINVFIDGVNYTGTSWVSNSSNNWTVINNKTLGALDTSVINFTYNTAATASEEATWLAYNKRVGENTTWRNTITLVNPSIENYTNIGINITTDPNAIASTVWVQNDTGDLVPHTFTQSNGNVNWTHNLPSGNSVFVIEYKNSEIDLSQTNYTTTTGQIKTYYNLTVSTNSTRDVKTTYAFFNFTDEGVVSNRFYKCTNDTYTDCTEEITDRVDVNFDDLDGDGRDDFVEWFIATMNNNTPGTYQLVSDSGFPIQTTETEEILNAPIKPFDTINWRTTVTMYNPNSFATEKTLKYEFPTGVRDIELDNIGKNLQYDPYGVLQPYVTIIDSDDTEHLTSVYLSPGETKTFVLTYKTDSITVFTSTFFPDYFKVGEMSEVTKVLRIKNQAEKDVSDLEHRITIDYAEELRVCEGEYERGCPDENDGNYENVTIDTDSLIKGDYKLELENIEAGETKLITLTYYVPTANIEKEEDGRRSIDGILTNFRKYELLSSAHFTMDDVRLREGEIPCNQIIDVLACRSNGLCDLPIAFTCDTNLKLGSFGVGERKTVYLWYIEDETESENPSLWYKILEFGNRYYLEKGSLAYYLFGFLGVEEDGQLYVTTGRIILFLSAIIFIMLVLISILYLGKKSK